MKGGLLEKQHVMIDTARGSLVYLGTLPQPLVYGKGHCSLYTVDNCQMGL
jgi:hypothetical protein